MFDGVRGVELSAILGLDRPRTDKFHGRTGKNPGLVNNHGLLLVGVAERQDTKDRPAVIGIVIGDTIHDPPESFGDDAGSRAYGRLHG